MKILKAMALFGILNQLTMAEITYIIQLLNALISEMELMRIGALQIPTTENNIHNFVLNVWILS